MIKSAVPDQSKINSTSYEPRHEQNPGPVMKYAECLKTVGTSFKDNVKIFSLNCRSIVGQNSTLKQLMDDMGKTLFWLYRNPAQKE